MLNLIAAVLNNWRVALFLSLILSLAGFFVVTKARLTAAQNAADNYRAELLQYKTTAQKLSDELESANKLAKQTDALLTKREAEKNAAEKQAATARIKYRNIVEGSRDACIDNAVPADVLGWLRDNAN